uniref:Homeobox domain-containing protein n=1 Tax=Ascaris lumbricoides TaxID=6252 RepID=A0A0M3IMW6_ASCLU
MISAFCGTCGHYLIVPPDLGPASVKVGAQQVEAPAEMELQPPVVRRKRQYDTEQARRADVCAAYLKRFRATEPELMAEIAREHDLQLP